jgi:hypothetical protein
MRGAPSLALQACIKELVVSQDFNKKTHGCRRLACALGISESSLEWSTAPHPPDVLEMVQRTACRRTNALPQSIDFQGLGSCGRISQTVDAAPRREFCGAIGQRAKLFGRPHL